MHWSVNPASHRVLAFTTRRCLIIECHRLTPTGPRSVNMAFNTLRLLIPTEPPDRKLSKIEILRLAGSYITHLDNQLYTGDVEQPCLQTKDGDNRSTSLCTFCWSAVKKDNNSTTTGHIYKTPF
ncbi:transcription factor 15-like isoform X3 [Choristoneura fumiferana]|uniref:transcription factor 15-like isoform X3 n=1 Tax=Choristoneura fumiferana TaxID=7141 RepID=UPI003D15769E